MVLEVIRKRQSVRSYQDKEIPEEVLQQVLEAGRLAPSASNKQCWKFIVVKDEDLRKKLIPACKNQKFIGEAPVVIAGCATNPDYVMTCGEHSYPIDLAIALDHMSLQAAALGLGTCWIGAFYQDQVKEILGVPEDVRVVSLMPLGYPKELGTKTERKPLSEIIC
ncbi:MAG: nitroreductase family protein, partial [Candidatus Atribacteria bacterium]|nr:nitroreductase family protein [Candidatus Atribacteria bacterium]